MSSRILVLYGTTDGQTRRISLALGETLRTAGADVDVANAAGTGPVPVPDGYDAVIVAASVHAGGYQRAVRNWVRAHAAALAARPTAFVSVCLGVLEHKPGTDAELAQIRERFFSACGWRPQTVKVVAGALPYTRYGWLKKRLMRRLVSRTTGDLDTSRDYDYTNWDDLAAFGRTFAAALAPAADRARLAG
jgi:menaquinone-dependent protoporphyrinogen oxidase